MMKRLYKQLVIIGAGPAGMAAAIDAQNNRMDFIIIENQQPGWFAKDSINQHYVVDGYLGFSDFSGTSLIESFTEHLKIKNIKILKYNIRGIKKESDFTVFCDECEIHAKFVIIATGTVPKKLCLSNYDKFLGVNIFNFVCKDEIDLNGKDVVVLGGRNSGVTTAIYLSETIGSKVTLIEKSEHLNATTKYIERLDKTNVKVFTSSNVYRLNGIHKLESIDLYIGKKEYTINLDAMFVCIGMRPNTKLFFNLSIVKDDSGYIIVNPITMETSIQGLYAIGDINQLNPKQVSNATANGKTAVYFISKKI